MNTDPSHAQPLIDQSRPFLEQFVPMLPPLMLAVLGGVVRALAGRRTGCSFWRLLADMAVNATVAVFVGAVVGLCLQALDWNLGVKGGLIGLSGWLGTDLLKIMAARWLDTVKKCGMPGGQ